MIDVCRKAAYGYDQRAEVLGQEGMLMSENLQPSSVRKFTGEVSQATHTQGSNPGLSASTPEANRPGSVPLAGEHRLAGLTPGYLVQACYSRVRPLP